MADGFLDGRVDNFDGLLKDHYELILSDSPCQVLYSNHVEGFGLLTLLIKNNIYQSGVSAK